MKNTPQKAAMGVLVNLLKAAGDTNVSLHSLARQLQGLLPAPAPGEPPGLLAEVLGILSEGPENDAFFKRVLQNASAEDLEELLLMQLSAQEEFLP